MFEHLCYCRAFEGSRLVEQFLKMAGNTTHRPYGQVGSLIECCISLEELAEMLYHE